MIFDETPPEPGYVTDAVVERIIDSDTIEISLKRTLKIRMQDNQAAHEGLIFDAPEKNTELGQQAIKCLKRHIKKGDIVRLFIPTQNSDKLLDILTFDRIIGEIWHKGQKLTSLLIGKGLGRFIKKKDRVITAWPCDKEP